MLVHIRTALLAYDYILTIQDEWSLLCRRKWTGSTWIFIVNRIVILAFLLIQIAPFNAQVSVTVHERIIY